MPGNVLFDKFESPSAVPDVAVPEPARRQMRLCIAITTVFGTSHVFVPAIHLLMTAVRLRAANYSTTPAGPADAGAAET
jgi:hypothetical protein